MVPSADMVRMASNLVSYSARNCALMPVAGQARTCSDSGENLLGAEPFDVW